MWGWWVAWENSQHLAKPPLVSLPNGVWEMSTEIPYWWRHYPELSSASDWLNQISHAAWPIRSTTQIWVVMRYQYGISALVSQTPFGGEISGSRWRAGKERAALLSFSLRALPLTFIFSCICFTCFLKWKSWSQATTIIWYIFKTISAWVYEWPLYVMLLTKDIQLKHLVVYNSKTSLTLDWQSKES